MPIERAMTPLDEDPTMDGSVDVELPPEEEGMTEPEQPGHLDNLAELLEEKELSKIASELIEGFDSDQQSRSEWLHTYTEGLNYLGFSMEERSVPFEGASGVFHPILSESVVRFQSNAIGEIFPAAGPVLTRILGDETSDKMNQSKRIKEEMNYQLTENMTEYRSETERLLFRLPLAGSVFRKIYFDPMRKRPSALMVPAEDLVLDNQTSNMETADRITHILRKSKNEVKKLMRDGFYRRVDIPDATPFFQEGKEKEASLTGIRPVVEKDTRHTILEFHVNYNLPEPFDDPDEIADPYVIAIEKSSMKVLSIYRNWDEGDQNRLPKQYFIPYEYMPGLGFYGFGLIHMLGSIAKASTSILRQLIDAGTLANLPGGLKTRGLRTKGGDAPIQPGEWRDVDVPAGAIKDNLFPLPYKEPSAVLAALLAGLVDEGRRIGSIADMETGSVSENAPVGTTLALMERSLKVMSAVHARLHASLRRELRLIARVIGEYMPPQYDWDDKGEFNRQEDFDSRIDILPVSDPNAATQAQKIVQLQAVMQLAQQNPEIYNLKELHRAGLQAIGIKNDERILPIDQPPPRLDPVQENMNLLTSQPVKVYPDQDHSAHMQVHISAMMDPKTMELLMRSPSAPKIQGQMESHIMEHMAHQYRAEIEQQMGVQLPPIGEELPPEIEARLSRLIAEAATRLQDEHKKEFERKKAEEIAADPVFQLREREVAMKERETQNKIDLSNKELIVDIAKTAAKEMMDMRRIESEEARAGAKIGADLVTFGAQLESEERREGVSLGKEIAENIREDARTIQQMDEESRHREADRLAQVQIARMRPKPSSSK